jgi:hypothetical protein
MTDKRSNADRFRDFGFHLPKAAGGMTVGESE